MLAPHWGVDWNGTYLWARYSYQAFVPTQGRGLKQHLNRVADGPQIGLPHTGVWIETALTVAKVISERSSPRHRGMDLNAACTEGDLTWIYSPFRRGVISGLNQTQNRTGSIRLHAGVWIERGGSMNR